MFRLHRFQSGKVAGVIVRWGKYSTYCNRVHGYDEFLPRPILYTPAAKWWYVGALSFWWGRLHWQTTLA